MLSSAGTPIAGAAVAWTISDPSVASIDANGLATALRVGFATVTATSQGKSASAILSERGALALPVRSQYVGTNLAGINYYGTSLPFVDLMKSSMPWLSNISGQPWGSGTFPKTADGSPASLAAGQTAISAVVMGSAHYPAGQYTVLWDGDGTVDFPLDKIKVDSQVAGRAVIEPVDFTQTMWVGIAKTNPANPVRNMRFLMPGTEATYLAQPFNPAYLAHTAPFSVVRFMDWGSTNGSTVVEWADRAQVSDETWAKGKGVPIEAMIDFANTLHVDPWFCIPHMASDDYIKQFATLLRSRLDPTLRPRIEYSNEMWNWGFVQTHWGVTQSKALGLSQPWGTPSLFYAKRATEAFKIMQGVYGADSGRLFRVLSGQAAWTQFLDNALAYQGTAANVDAIAIAPYFQAKSADTVANVAVSEALTSDQVVGQMQASVEGDMVAWIKASAALAQKYNLKLEAYESGPGDTAYKFATADQPQMVALFTAANRNPRMRALYSEFFGEWKALGGDTMNQFSDVGGWSVWGFWGALQYTYQDVATSPKYEGLMDFISANPIAAPAAP